VLHVRALLGLSRREDALALADAEVELHARRGARGHEAMARLSKAYALEGDEAIAELRTAATCAAASPMRLAEAHVLAELGGRLRRAGRRTEARDPLRQAQDLARRAGATGLENHAREELIIAGARPQRVALAGVDSLTPSERRVADLAARGLSNRDIAETLFVTLKTVEVHLGHAYAKLDIKGRAQLATALGGE
jgi:DNA-binding CsgD family transcriptional regulator